MAENIKEKAKPVEAIKEVYVRADIGYAQWHWESNEQYARRLQRECDDFVEHCRDHRSIDHIRLEVVTEKHMVCSNCGLPWEVFCDDEMPPRYYCDYCGVLTEENNG